MPKPKLPPQGGEKWLCLGMFLMLMFSVVTVVIAIYCIVIIYIPSVKLLQSQILEGEPKRCTTTVVERNISGTPEDQRCAWSSCEEWCLSSPSTPCSKIHGLLRDRGADMTWENCEMATPWFVDHTCTTLENLSPMNCKRSKFELKDKGSVEECRTFTSLISCEMGECKNVSKIYDCTYVNTLEELQESQGNPGYVTDGYCNCNQCTTSNTTLVEDVKLGSLHCPKDTRYCFEKGRNPETYSEEKRELCKSPKCESCPDICNSRQHCLSMHSRQDVAYFGVDRTKNPPEPKLTYYQCIEGECIKVHTLKCARTCDFQKFNFTDKNMILFSGERVVMSNCRKAFINDSNTELPQKSIVNPDWAWMAATCSKITISEDFPGTIYGSDCTNGTWLHDLKITNYSQLTREYAKHREDRNRFIKFHEDNTTSLIPLEQDITIFNKTRIKKNMQGCVNTLSMECLDFFTRYGKDGANYTSPVSYDCFYDPNNDEYAVIDFAPERTTKFLVFWALFPACSILFSCIYLCVCSKMMYTGEDGHMRIFLMGRPVTGIGHVVVYKPPPKKEKPKRKLVEEEKNDPVAI